MEFNFENATTVKINVQIFCILMIKSYPKNRCYNYAISIWYPIKMPPNWCTPNFQCYFQFYSNWLDSQWYHCSRDFVSYSLGIGIAGANFFFDKQKKRRRKQLSFKRICKCENKHPTQSVTLNAILNWKYARTHARTRFNLRLDPVKFDSWHISIACWNVLHQIFWRKRKMN